MESEYQRRQRKIEENTAKQAKHTQRAADLAEQDAILNMQYNEAFLAEQQAQTAAAFQAAQDSEAARQMSAEALAHTKGQRVDNWKANTPAGKIYNRWYKAAAADLQEWDRLDALWHDAIRRDRDTVLNEVETKFGSIPMTKVKDQEFTSNALFFCSPAPIVYCGAAMILNVPLGWFGRHLPNFSEATAFIITIIMVMLAGVMWVVSQVTDKKVTEKQEAKKAYRHDRMVEFFGFDNQGDFTVSPDDYNKPYIGDRVNEARQAVRDVESASFPRALPAVPKARSCLLSEAFSIVQSGEAPASARAEFLRAFGVDSSNPSDERHWNTETILLADEYNSAV